MGIVHWMPLGASPGAVTSALAYLKHTHGERTHDWGTTVEAVVLFAPREIVEGRDRVDIATWNRYGTDTASDRSRDANVVDVVLRFIEKDILEIMPKPSVYWGEAFAYDYFKSFRSAAEGLLGFLSPPGKKGKHVWLNLTGGTNVMNAALLQVAFLSGLVSRAYYTYHVPTTLTAYLRPTRNFQFVEVPLIKTAFDHAYYAAMWAIGELQGKHEWVPSSDLFAFLKQSAAWEYFSAVPQERLELEILTKLDGSEIKRQTRESGEKTYNVRLTEHGEKLLQTMNEPLFRALTRRGHPEKNDLPFSHAWQQYDWREKKWRPPETARTTDL